jgi:valyl-tRNA synthetase
MRDRLDLQLMADPGLSDNAFFPVVSKMANLGSLSFTGEKPEGAASFIVGTVQYFILLGDKLDVKAELEKLSQELEYNRGFLASVMKKLENDKFVKNAPAQVIETERKKKSDAELKIESLESRMKELAGK